MFLKDIKPYRKIIELHDKGHGISSDRKTNQNILSIFDKYLKFVEYPGSEPSAVGCGPCIVNAYTRLLGLIGREEAKQPIYKEDLKEVTGRSIETDIKVVNPEELKWGGLKKYAKAKGINTKGLNKPTILSLLKAL